jgi:hypothetical protein
MSKQILRRRKGATHPNTLPGSDTAVFNSLSLSLSLSLPLLCSREPAGNLPARLAQSGGVFAPARGIRARSDAQTEARCLLSIFQMPSIVLLLPLARAPTFPRARCSACIPTCASVRHGHRQTPQYIPGGPYSSQTVFIVGHSCSSVAQDLPMRCHQRHPPTLTLMERQRGPVRETRIQAEGQREHLPGFPDCNKSSS